VGSGSILSDGLAHVLAHALAHVLARPHHAANVQPRYPAARAGHATAQSPHTAGHAWQAAGGSGSAAFIEPATRDVAVGAAAAGRVSAIGRASAIGLGPLMTA
jgi:hypothetical protein